MSTIKWLLLFALMYKSCQAAYVAEGYFVVDHKVLELYINERTESNAQVRVQKATDELKKDIEYLLTEVNKLYRTFKPRGLDIQVKVRALDILKSNIFSGSLLHGDVINQDTALNTFDSWLKSRGSYSHLHYDFATLWTGFDLSGSTVGYAHIGRICNGDKASSVVEFNGIYQVAIATAHEIAHILGSSHDGAASSHIMAATGGPKDTDRWSFSVCSTSDILDYISTLTTNCLTTSSSQSTTPSSSRASYDGQMLNPDVICTRSRNTSTTYMCKDSNLYGDAIPQGDKICTYIYCAKPGTHLCLPAYSSDGMICGPAKRCENGKCVHDSTPQSQNADPNCLWGDVKQLSFSRPAFTGDCAHYLTAYGVDSCYDPLIAEMCCATCKTHNSGVKGCEYGDKSSDCTHHTAQSICHSSRNQALCCHTCSSYITRRSFPLNLPSDVEIVPGINQNTLPIMTQKEKGIDDDIFTYDNDI